MTALSRREFTLEAALAILAGCVITVSEACGSSSSSTPAPSPAPVATADVNGVIGTNHGHVAVVTAAQINAGGAVTMSIQGTAAHPHTVTLAQADFTALRNRQAINTTSTTDFSSFFGNHSHTVTFTPA